MTSRWECPKCGLYIGVGASETPEEHLKACTVKPLHVRVAEALGWTDIHPRGTPGCCGDILLPGIRWAGRASGNVLIGFIGRHDPVPSYDSDWSATGPLIEKFQIALYYGENEWLAYPSADIQSGTGGDFKDHLWLDGSTFDAHKGPTPLIAVCHLLLALAEAGKLKVQ